MPPSPTTQQSRAFVKPLRANRRVALILLGVMACMFAGALAFALSTQSFRRQNDKGITQGRPKRRPPLDDAPTSDNTPTPPAQLAALGWLPRESSLLVGVHVRELAQNRSWQNSADAADQAGRRTSNFSVASLTKLIPFKIDDLDHLVLGVKLDDALPPRMTLVVRTRQDYDEAALLQTLEDKRKERAGGDGPCTTIARRPRHLGERQSVFSIAARLRSVLSESIWSRFPPPLPRT